MESREERRARLAALREGASRKRTAASDPAELFEETVEERDEEIEEVEDARGEKRQVRLKFRNYQPRTAELKEQRAKRKEVAPLDVQVEPALQEFRQKHSERVGREGEGTDVHNLAPSKANFDLKRDVAKRMQRLERQTQEAIIEMIKERMQKEDVIRSEQEQGKSSLADAVADTNMSDVVGVDDMD